MPSPHTAKPTRWPSPSSTECLANQGTSSDSWAARAIRAPALGFAAAFALALPMLGTTFIGATLATHATGLTPAWQRLLGLVGGSLLLTAGLGNLAIADGSALIFVGLLGFAALLVWLLATGVRLVRSDVDLPSAAANRHTSRAQRA